MGVEKGSQVKAEEIGSEDTRNPLECINLSEEEELLLSKLRAEAAHEAQKMGKIIRSVQNKDLNRGRGGEQK